jgi:hypothetical protein
MDRDTRRPRRMRPAYRPIMSCCPCRRVSCSPRCEQSTHVSRRGRECSQIRRSPMPISETIVSIPHPSHCAMFIPPRAPCTPSPRLRPRSRTPPAAHPATVRRRERRPLDTIGYRLDARRLHFTSGFFRFRRRNYRATIWGTRSTGPAGRIAGRPPPRPQYSRSTRTGRFTRERVATCAINASSNSTAAGINLSLT